MNLYILRNGRKLLSQQSNCHTLFLMQKFSICYLQRDHNIDERQHVVQVTSIFSIEVSDVLRDFAKQDELPLCCPFCQKFHHNQ